MDSRLRGNDNGMFFVCRCLSGERGNGEEILGFGYQIQQTGADVAIASLFLSDPDPTLEFLGASFSLIKREDEITSYDNLCHTLVAAEPEPTKRFELTFITPTFFAQDRIHLEGPLSHPLKILSLTYLFMYFLPPNTKAL